MNLAKGTATGTLQGEFPGCDCPKPDGKCPCGDACQCAATAMSKALVDAGYVVAPCGDKKGPCPAVARGTCTCGPNCECGDDCQCALCPGVSVKGKASKSRSSTRWSSRASRGSPSATRKLGQARRGKCVLVCKGRSRVVWPPAPPGERGPSQAIAAQPRERPFELPLFQLGHARLRRELVDVLVRRLDQVAAASATPRMAAAYADRPFASTNRRSASSAKSTSIDGGGAMRVRGADRARAAFFAAASNQSPSGFSSGRRHVTDLRDDAAELSVVSEGGGGGATASSSRNVASTKAIVAADPTDDRRLSSTGALMTSGDSKVAGKSSAASCGSVGHMGVAWAVSEKGGELVGGCGRPYNASLFVGLRRRQVGAGLGGREALLRATSHRRRGRSPPAWQRRRRLHALTRRVDSHAATLS